MFAPSSLSSLLSPRAEREKAGPFVPLAGLVHLPRRQDMGCRRVGADMGRRWSGTRHKCPSFSQLSRMRTCYIASSSGHRFLHWHSNTLHSRAAGTHSTLVSCPSSCPRPSPLPPPQNITRLHSFTIHCFYRSLRHSVLLFYLSDSATLFDSRYCLTALFLPSRSVLSPPAHFPSPPLLSSA